MNLVWSWALENFSGMIFSNGIIFPSTKEVLMKRTFTAFLEYDDETKLYVGMIPNVPGAHTQAENLDELQRNLQEVLELCLEENPEIANETLHFIGTQQVEVVL
jgi:predicted RNase H-like HicB family nuclease